MKRGQVWRPSLARPTSKWRFDVTRRFGNRTIAQQLCRFFASGCCVVDTHYSICLYAVASRRSKLSATLMEIADGVSQESECVHLVSQRGTELRHLISAASLITVTLAAWLCHLIFTLFLLTSMPAKHLAFGIAILGTVFGGWFAAQWVRAMRREKGADSRYLWSVCGGVLFGAVMGAGPAIAAGLVACTVIVAFFERVLGHVDGFMVVAAGCLVTSTVVVICSVFSAWFVTRPGSGDADPVEGRLRCVACAYWPAGKT